MKEIDTETKLKALELYVQGKSNREIATGLGISHPTAGKIISGDKQRKGFICSG